MKIYKGTIPFTLAMLGPVAIILAAGAYADMKGKPSQVKDTGARVVEGANTIEFNDYKNLTIGFDDNKDGELDRCNAKLYSKFPMTKPCNEKEMATTQESYREPYRLLGIQNKTDAKQDVQK